jgi:hypothetical protein
MLEKSAYRYAQLTSRPLRDLIPIFHLPQPPAQTPPLLPSQILPRPINHPHWAGDLALFFGSIFSLSRRQKSGGVLEVPVSYPDLGIWTGVLVLHQGVNFPIAIAIPFGRVPHVRPTVHGPKTMSSNAFTLGTFLWLVGGGSHADTKAQKAMSTAGVNG